MFFLLPNDFLGVLTSFSLLVSYGAIVFEGGISLASILSIKADIRAPLAGPLFFTMYDQNIRKLFNLFRLHTFLNFELKNIIANLMMD